MKKWKLLALVVLALALLCGTAGGGEILDHYEGLTTYDNKVYALVSRGIDWMNYSPSKIVEFDAELKELRSLELKVGEVEALNSLNLALHDGKLYIGSIGGTMGGENGDIWEVDVASWTARQILHMGDSNGIYGLAIADDGTAFFLTGGYDSSWDYVATLYVTTAAALSAGNRGTAIPLSGSGYSWGIAWSEFDQTLWVMAGTELQARSKSGAPLKTFSPYDLGNNISTIAVLEGRTGLFYTASDYVTTSVGRITKAGSSYTVQRDLLTNLGGGTAVFAFKNNSDNARVLLREYNYGPNDIVYIYDPDDLSLPIINVSDWASNIHAITTLGRYLYLGTYESYASGDPATQLSGEIIRVDMSNWPDWEEPKSSDSSGCDSGFGAAALLFLIPAALIRSRKR